MYVLEFLLENKNNSYRYFDRMFWCKFRIQNILISHAVKQMKKLRHDSAYTNAKKRYAVCKADSSALLNAKIKEYGLAKAGLYAYVKAQQKKHAKYITSLEAQAIADSVLAAVNKYLYGDGKELRHKRLSDIRTASAKNLSNGIIPGMESRTCRFGLKKHSMDCRFIIKDYNQWAEACFQKDRDKVKFYRLSRKQFNSGYRYYVQFVIDAEPVRKHDCGEGRCGIDPGVSSIAAVTDGKCFLEELAPEAGRYNRKIVRVQRQMERSRRINSPGCYHEDGTVKKGVKFTKSRRYKKLQRKFRALHRKRAACIRQSHSILADRILEHCNSVICEKMDFKKLAVRSKRPAKRQEKESSVTGKDGAVKAVHKFKRKKRFGKSLQCRSPGLFLEILERKCLRHGFQMLEADTKAFKASQYNHIDDTYVKKKLGDRWNYFTYKGEGIKIQRDLYSAFLIKNADSSLRHADREKCVDGFGRFMEMHDRCIQEVMEDSQKRLSCFGF